MYVFFIFVGFADFWNRLPIFPKSDQPPKRPIRIETDRGSNHPDARSSRHLITEITRKTMRPGLALSAVRTEAKSLNV